MTSNQYDAIIIGRGVSGATPALAGGAREAACSEHGSSLGWHSESASADFHELRQDFSPTDKQEDAQ